VLCAYPSHSYFKPYATKYPTLRITIKPYYYNASDICLLMLGPTTCSNFTRLQDEKLINNSTMVMMVKLTKQSDEYLFRVRLFQGRSHMDHFSFHKLHLLSIYIRYLHHPVSHTISHHHLIYHNALSHYIRTHIITILLLPFYYVLFVILHYMILSYILSLTHRIFEYVSLYRAQH
jgi:hypothetical protein